MKLTYKFKCNKKNLLPLVKQTKDEAHVCSCFFKIEITFRGEKMSSGLPALDSHFLLDFGPTVLPIL